MARSRTLPLLATIAALIGLAIALWFALDGRESPSGIELVSPNPAESAAAPSSSLELGSSDSATAPDALSPDRSRADESATSWIDGRVRFPPGAPPDETLAVLAQVEGGDPDRAMVASDGSFRLRAVPEGSKAAALHLDGRFLFLAEPQTAALTAGSPEIALSPSLGGWLHGRCRVPSRPEDEGLLADTKLQFLVSNDGDGVFGLGSDQRNEASVADDHTYEFRGLDPGRTFHLMAQPDAFLPVIETKLRLAPGEERVLDLAFDPGASVAGRVVDDAGAPVPGARVFRGGGNNFDFFGSRGSTTDSRDDGSFVLRALRPGKVRLEAKEEGFVDGTSEPLVLGANQVLTGVEIVLSRGATLAGHVLWPDGKPAAKAHVSVRTSIDGEEHTIAGPTEDDGRFSLSGLGDGPCEVLASASPGGEISDEGSEEERLRAAIRSARGAGARQMVAQLGMLQRHETRGPVWTAAQSDVQPGLGELTLVLRPPVAVGGAVADPSGLPIAEFQVRAVRQSVAGVDFVGDRQVSREFEDPGGAFTFELEPGTWKLGATADGYLPLDGDRLVEVPYAGEPIVLVLHRTASVSGIVLDPSGAPHGAHVRADNGEMRVRGASGGAEADAEGRFTLERLPPGAVSITATGEEWARSAPVALELAPGQAVQDVVLRLSLGGTLTGEAYGPGGEPLAATSVQCQTIGSGDHRSATTDGSGRFRIEHLTPGVYQVLVEPDVDMFVGMVSSGEEPDLGKIFEQLRMSSAEVREGETTHVVLGEPAKSPVRVRGLVTEAGEPVEGATVIALAEGEEVLSHMRMDRTDADGRFEVELRRPGGTVFTVQRDGGDEANGTQFLEDVPEAESYDIELEMPTGRIVVEARGPDGEPARAVHLTLEREGALAPNLSMFSGGARTDEHGRYAFGNLRPGTYTLRTGGMGRYGASSELGTAIVEGIELGEGDVEDVELTLSSAGTVEGRVLVAGGAPAAGAAVFVRDARGRLLSPLTPCTADALGRFRYDGIAPGSVTVSARRGAEAAAVEAEVLVRSGETSPVELSLEPGTIVVVVLEGDEGEALRASVRVTDAKGREYAGMAAAANIEASLFQGFTSREHKVGPLPPGKYVVSATTQDGRTAKKPVTLAGQDERTVRLKFD